MKKSSKVVFALTGLAVLCVCAAMAVPMGAGDGAGHKGMMQDGNAPAMNEERMQQMITKMQANGVDTTALETAIENGDREAVHTFLQERMQEMIAKMQANGVDTTALETAIENGDREAVRTFLQENRPADAPEQKGEGQMPAMNEERMQEMIAKMQANGVDTTALETAIADGDREAVQEFMQENKPADAPEKGDGLHRGSVH